MVEYLLIGTLLGLVQVAAALPWIAAIDPVGFKAWLRRALRGSLGVQVGGGILAALIVAVRLFRLLVTNDPDQLVLCGRIYASVLQIQLSADLFVLFFYLLLKLWPHGGAVTLAAFREGVRQPLFWLLVIGGLFFPLFGLVWTIFLPYFTFGEDFKMMKEVDFDLIMLIATVFGVVAASTSISEEIEGRTAITVMSKPVSRRQFLLGKFAGILLAALAMTLILGWFLGWIFYIKPRLFPYESLPNPLEKIPDPAWVVHWVKGLPFDAELKALLKGVALWGDDLANISLGLVLGFCQLTVLLGIAVALATRMPMIANLMICLIVFFLGHLAPILSAVSQDRYELVKFTADVFNLLLPGLELYHMGPVVVRDNPLSLADFGLYVLGVALYTVLYTAIALLFGLILFEDRDLA